MNIYSEVFMCKKATKIEEVMLTCGYFPLSSEDLTNFYINTDEARGVNLLQELSVLYKKLPDLCSQVICLGHRGVGKSTMFFQFEQEMNLDYEIVSFSVQDSFDTEKISFTDLLCLIYKTLLENYKDLLEDSDDLQQVYDLWNSTQKEETIQARSASLKVGAQAECSLGTKLLKLVSQISSTLNFSSDSRRTVTHHIQTFITDYIDSLNSLVLMIERKCSKHLLLIIDDLDKISQSSTTDIFVEHPTYFKKINLRLVLTAPIWLKYMPEFAGVCSSSFTKAVRYPMIAVVDCNHNKIPHGYNALHDIVMAHVEQSLISDSALDLAILMSGGQIRDLLEIISNAAAFCLQVSGSSIIDDLSVRKAFQNLQESFEDRLRKEDADILMKIIKNPLDLLDTSYSKLHELMYSGAILEYNGKQWRGVHPAAMACLVKSGLLSTDDFRTYTLFDL